MSLEIAIILALIVLALAYLYRRQNHRAQEHLDLVNAWSSLNDAFDSLLARVQALEERLPTPAKKPAPKKTGTRRRKGGQRAA